MLLWRRSENFGAPRVACSNWARLDSDIAIDYLTPIDFGR
jgi:hypothetical protein